MENYYEIPQPESIDNHSKEQAMASYMMMFFSMAAGLPLPIINLIASFVYYSFTKKKGRFVHFHALQSLLSQIPLTLLNSYAVIRIIIILFTTSSFPAFSDAFIGYLITVGIFNLIYIVFSAIAAVKAYKGRMYYFIFFGRIAYHNTFRMKDEIMEEFSNPPRNAPPKM